MPHRRSIELGIRLAKTSAVAQESTPGLEAYPPTVSFRSFEPFRVRPTSRLHSKGWRRSLEGVAAEKAFTDQPEPPQQAHRQSPPQQPLAFDSWGPGSGGTAGGRDGCT